jgi:hypothetical protein
MARVLIAGGFPEEMPAVLAKALGKAAAARLAQLGELPAGATSAAEAEIHRLVERDRLPAKILALFGALDPEARMAAVEEVEDIAGSIDAFLGEISANSTERSAVAA